MRRGLPILLAAALAFPAGAAAATQLPDPGRYAPEVRLAEGETLFPVRPEGFIAHSDLVWYGCGATASSRQTGVDPVRLGSAAADPYRSPPYWADGRPGCPPGPAPGQTVTFGAGEWTRPLGGGPRPGVLLRYPANGFALDLRDEFRPGNHDLTRVPITYESGRIGSGSWITYWLFYAFNAKEKGQHEGDWERVSVRFDSRAKPTRIAYYAHNGAPRVCAFADVGRIAGRHPVVFSARGSHASYPSAGDRVGASGKVDHTDDTGTRWRTWVSGIRSPQVPWYGFGGAWGERGADRGTTGPPGPGQRTPHDWDTGRRKRCDKP
ncbi:MAG TPA: Vps62-related protein [Thermoleophilaceae bacterium]|nr:Vps62-related protein [Thermoleophilaceae bacterium]